MKIIGFFLVAVICCGVTCSAAGDVLPQSKAVSITPCVFGEADEIQLVLPEEHPKRFAIREPDGNWIYVIDKGNRYSLLDEDVFSENSTFHFKVREMKGVLFDENGASSVVHVFKKPGEYLFYFADNLETEPDSTYSLSRTVVYKGQR